MKVVWLHGELDLMAECEADIQVLRAMHTELVGPAVYDAAADTYQPTKPGAMVPVTWGRCVTTTRWNWVPFQERKK